MECRRNRGSHHCGNRAPRSRDAEAPHGLSPSAAHYSPRKGVTGRARRFRLGLVDRDRGLDSCGLGVVRHRRAASARAFADWYAFALLALYLTVQSTVVLVTGHRAGPSTLGIAWTGVTTLVMFLLAAGKARTGTALDNPVLRKRGG